MKTSSLLLSFAGLLIAAVAHGQENNGSTFPQPAQSPPLSYRHASTVHEGFFRGIADGIRATGEAEYNRAAAALIGQEARKASYANDYLRAETFWNMRNLHRSQTATRKPQRPTPVAIAKPEVAPVSLRIHVPIDPSQPNFVWPAAFDHPAFANTRGRITVLFAQRASDNSGPHSENYIRIKNTATEMRGLLADLARELRPMAHIEAHKFLEQLTYEASQPVRLKLASK